MILQTASTRNILAGQSALIPSTRPWKNPVALRLPDDGENVRHELLCAVAGSGSGTKLVKDAQRMGLEDGERSGCKWCTPGVPHPLLDGVKIQVLAKYPSIVRMRAARGRLEVVRRDEKKDLVCM